MEGPEFSFLMAGTILLPFYRNVKNYLVYKAVTCKHMCLIFTPEFGTVQNSLKSVIELGIIATFIKHDL